MSTSMQPLRPRTSGINWWVASVFVFGVGLGLLIEDLHAMAQEIEVPWECSGYSGEAQSRCVRTLLELQHEKITRLEEQLKAQEGTVSELKEKLERQETLARREAQAYKKNSRHSVLPYAYAYPPPYPFSYGFALYPPSRGIYLGTPWRYPHYYGYGPGYWRQPGLSFNFRGGGYRHRHR